MRVRPGKLVPLLVLPLAVLAACGDGATQSGAGGNTGGSGGVVPTPGEGVYDFLATELNFYYPEGLGESEADTTNPCGLDTTTDNTTYRPLLFDGLVVDGFDLDEVTADVPAARSVGHDGGDVATQ